MPGVRRLLIDTDTASDDAVALVMALRTPGVVVEAITVVAGNVPLERGVQNALYTVELCREQGAAAVPVYAGHAAPPDRPLDTAQFVHGEDGMGDIGLPLAGRAPAPGDAVEVMIERVRARPGEITLVTLGPLTNVAAALARAPDLARLLGGCVVMGGASDAVGNVTPVSEYNFWADPTSARAVLAAGLPITLVGWDLSRKHAVLDAGDAARLRAVGTPLAAFCTDIQRTVDVFSRQRMALAGFDLPDPLAMAVALDQAVATRSCRRYVTVETSGGLCRGQAVLDHFGMLGQPPNAEVVLEADRRRFLSLLHRAVGDRT